MQLFSVMNGRFRNWVFTMNWPGYALTPDIDLPGSPVTFLVWQLELGETGNEHYQGYVELDRPCSLLQMQQLGGHMFLGAHFEVIYFAPKLLYCLWPVYWHCDADRSLCDCYFVVVRLVVAQL